jgi:hypothetical protein
MDDESFHLVLSLQLEDLNRLLDSSVHVKDHVNISDGGVALVSYRDELATQLRFLQHRRMGRSIARAVIRDEPPCGKSEIGRTMPSVIEC